MKTIASAATVVAAFSFLSRFVGFIRDRILAGIFGAGDTLDSYYAAFLVPDTIFNLLIVGALAASFIPVFTSLYRAPLTREKAWSFTSNIVNILVVIIIILSVIVFIFANPIATLITPGFSAHKHELVAQFMRIMLLSNFLLALSAVFGAVLQGMKRFLVYSLAPVLYNVGIITGALVFVPLIGKTGLAWGVVLGAGLHALVQILAAFQAGFRYKWVWKPKDADTREMGKIMLPRILGISVGQFNAFVMTVIASTLVAGSVTIFQFAYNIQFFVIGIVAVSFAVAAFPTLSELAAEKNKKEFIQTFSLTARQILFFIIPATIIFLLLRAQIVRVVVGAGRFGWEETIATADTLAFFTLSFFAQGLNYLLTRSYFAYKDTITPLLAGTVSAIINVISGLLFTHIFGVIGLAFAFSLSSIINLVLLWIPLRVKLGTLHESKILHSLFIIILAAMAQGVVTQGAKYILGGLITLDTFLGVLGSGLLSGGAGLLVYLMIAFGLKSPEAMMFVSSMQRQLFRSFVPTEPSTKDQNVV